MLVTVNEGGGRGITAVEETKICSSWQTEQGRFSRAKRLGLAPLARKVDCAAAVIKLN